MFNILVLCTGNSARSILAEAVLNHDGADRVRAYSAGTNPTGQVNPAALRLLQRRNYPPNGYRSKSWEEFAADGAPVMDLVVTVCGSAANEVCPTWPGAPLSAHWGVDDPAAAPADQVDLGFQIAFHQLSSRIHSFLALPFETLDRDSLQEHLNRIGAN